uniref:Transcription factor CBF/NF-Y/archaeal histone domain-containing protein n=1 Tax=Glycine max TaxID=3847 RepID=A0A0R0KL05_SOYBN
MRLRVHQLHHQRVSVFFFSSDSFLLRFSYLSSPAFNLKFLEFCRASDKCQREKRKTINGDDLLWAMATLGFEDYMDPLKIYLTRYREMEVIFNIFILMIE